MKIFVFGLDGLEYDLVEKWDLTCLKQLEYGRTVVPINDKTNHPFSPEVWGTFLLGKHEIVSATGSHHPLSMFLRSLKFLRKHIQLSLGLGRKVLHAMPVKWWGGLEYGIPSSQKTFLDLTKSKAINAPFYGNDCYSFIIMQRFNAGELSLQQTAEAYQKLYMERKNLILREVEKIRDEDVVFAFMHFPDILQHFLFTKPVKIKKHYFDLNNYVRTLKRKIDADVTFLIVSDHGFDLKTGTHSEHGFYSCNKHLDPKPEQITDFFKIIINESNAPNRT